MEQLLLHLFGDYIIQNDNVGTRKKEKSLTGLYYCIWHCITYALPFFLITNWLGVLLIAITHFLIDRWNIVGYFIALKNNVWTSNYCSGYYVDKRLDVSNFGFKPDKPKFLSIWLYIFQDNTLHLLINFAIITLIK